MKPKLEFEIDDTVKVTEFGVGLDVANEQTFVLIPVDLGVQKALFDMVKATLETLQKMEGGSKRYEPSEKYGNLDYLYVELNDEMVSTLRDLHNAENMNLNSQIFDKPEHIFCYFARFTDRKQNRLTAIRRASQFKGILRKRVISLVSDQLQLLTDRLFALDNDFDFIVDSRYVHILRPSGFEAIGKLQHAIMRAVPKNIAAIRKNLSFVNFENIEDYAKKHARAARYLASIRNQVNNLDKQALIKLCKNTGVMVTQPNGKIAVSEEHVMGFLEVLDRRRYEIELVKGHPERFKANSRKKLDK